MFSFVYVFFIVVLFYFNRLKSSLALLQPRSCLGLGIAMLSDGPRKWVFFVMASAPWNNIPTGVQPTPISFKQALKTWLFHQILGWDASHLGLSYFEFVYCIWLFPVMIFKMYRGFVFKFMW